MIYGFMIIIMIIILCYYFKKSEKSKRTSVIFIALFSDIAGCSIKSHSRLISYSRNIELADDIVSDPFRVYYLNKRRFIGTYKTGKTYHVHFIFKAADGYHFPTNLTQEDVRILCSKGCRVTHWQLVHRTNTNGDTVDLFEIEAEITVKRKSLF